LLDGNHEGCARRDARWEPGGAGSHPSAETTSGHGARRHRAGATAIRLFNIVCYEQLLREGRSAGPAARQDHRRPAVPCRGGPRSTQKLVRVCDGNDDEFASDARRPTVGGAGGSDAEMQWVFGSSDGDVRWLRSFGQPVGGR
jgi:hypothetical protein